MQIRKKWLNQMKNFFDKHFWEYYLASFCWWISSSCENHCTLVSSYYTDQKENQIFLIYKEIQSGAVAKSYMGKGFLKYEEMRKYFPIYEEAVSHIWLCNCSTLNFLIFEENLIFFFISVQYME